MTKPILFLHFLAAAAAVGTTIHLAIRLRRGFEGGDSAWWKSCLHARMVAIFYICLIATGALIYPAFKIDVRAAYFDDGFKLGTGLFEIKEHLAAFGLVPAIALWVLLRGRMPERFRSGSSRFFVWVLIAAVLGILIWNTLTGWYLVTVRSV